MGQFPNPLSQPIILRMSTALAIKGGPGHLQLVQRQPQREALLPQLPDHLPLLGGSQKFFFKDLVQGLDDEFLVRHQLF